MDTLTVAESLKMVLEAVIAKHGPEALDEMMKKARKDFRRKCRKESTENKAEYDAYGYIIYTKNGVEYRAWEDYLLKALQA